MLNFRSSEIRIAITAFLLVVALSSPKILSAQVTEQDNTDQQVLPNQFESDDSLNVDMGDDTDNVDSLLEKKISFENVYVPTYEDSIYISRLKAINSEIPLAYNDEVRKYIDLYVLHRREQVQRMLGLSKFYFPIFDQIFAQYGVPPEIKNLAIIESALNPHAVSRAGATGMWQFMYSTAKLYGLSINSYYDDRRDIIRATEGAAQYLKSMYDVYGDWLLAIASYNCGPQNVNRAITKSGGNTFWTIKNYLPKETRGYVPAFIAATYVMNYYDLHDLEPQYPNYCYDTIICVPVDGKMSCDQIARFTNLSMDELKFLNPGLRCNVIPALDQPYNIKLPSDRISMFSDNRDSIVLLSINAKQHYFFGPTGDTRLYVVRSGDNLGKIAGRYHVSVTQIKRWNHLSGNTIRVGQRLRLYPSHYYDDAGIASSKTNHSKSATVNSSVAKSSSIQSTRETTSKNSASAKYVYYKARFGDTLWDIARKHGTTVDSIRALNGSAKCDKLMPGTILKISPKG